jgi:hypothetical protein
MDSVCEAGSELASPMGAGGAFVQGGDDLIAVLGIPPEETNYQTTVILEEGAEEPMTDPVYDIVPNPNAEHVDLSDLRGVGEPHHSKLQRGQSDLRPYDDHDMVLNNASDADLENLAELVPDIKTRAGPAMLQQRLAASGLMGMHDQVVLQEDIDGAHVEVVNAVADARPAKEMGRTKPHHPTESMVVHDTHDHFTRKKQELTGLAYKNRVLHASPLPPRGDDEDSYPDSEHALEDLNAPGDIHGDTKIPSDLRNHHANHLGSSANSISTATQTHEVRMPMYLPTFKPATGCTNASDFIVRCFVARLRSGITVVKHGRSRWCKSRLRVLHIHPDGRSLSWKPAEGEPSSAKRPPKLDLSTCLEVRHAWSPDPQNPMYTGTPILRIKCEAANAHKSFALIFKQRTVDITAVTADQCKVLMEGFSALCFRLQVATLAGKEKAAQHARPMPEEDGVSTTASATLTNTSLSKTVVR